MKILHHSFILPDLLKDTNALVGGAAVEWYSWFEGFNKSGNQAGLLTWEGAKDYIGKDLDIDIVESINLNRGIPKLRILYYRLPKYYQTIKEYNPDIIVQECANMDTGLLAIVAKLLKKPFVYRVASDPDTDERAKYFINKGDYFFYKIGLKLADLIITQNTYQQNKIKERFPNKKVFVLHNPFSEFINGTIKTNIERSYIAWVGNFRYEKNLPALYEIVKELPELQFKIAGQSHAKTDVDTNKALQLLRESANVEFVGYLRRSEINNFMSNAYILLNTSYFEGFSNTFLEAWSSGTPVVSTKNVNPDNLISQNDLGVIAETYSQLPLLIKSLINNPDYERISNDCKVFVKKYHNPQYLAEKFVDIVNSCKR